MLTADVPSYPIVAVVRMSSAEGLDNRREIVENGGFDGTLAPWTSGNGSTSGNQFTVTDNVATCVVPPGDSNTLSQEIPQPAVGNAGYYFTLDLSLDAPGGGSGTNPASCQIDLQNGVGDLFYRQVIGVNGDIKTVYGSGTVRQGGILNMIVNVECSGAADSVIRLDNVVFYVYQADGGTSPDCSGGNASILVNGNFDTQYLPWTTSQGSSTSASFSISAGIANVLFAAGASVNDDEARISGSASITTDTNYLLTSDLYFTISEGGSCAVNFRNEFESLYFTGQITNSQSLPLRFEGTSDIASQQFAIGVSCSGPGENRVGIDDVSLVLNPGQNCSP